MRRQEPSCTAPQSPRMSCDKFSSFRSHLGNNPRVCVLRTNRGTLHSSETGSYHGASARARRIVFDNQLLHVHQNGHNLRVQVRKTHKCNRRTCWKSRGTAWVSNDRCGLENTAVRRRTLERRASCPPTLTRRWRPPPRDPYP